MANSSDYIKKYPTVESSFENVLKLLNLPKQKERKLREWQERGGNPYYKIHKKDTPGFGGDLNRAYYQEVGRKKEDFRSPIVGRPGEFYEYKDYGEDLPDTVGIFEHELLEDILAEVGGHAPQYEYARNVGKRKPPSLLEKLRKHFFPTAHDEINDILKEFQSSRTVKELHAQASRERGRFGEDVYGYGKDSTGAELFPLLFDNTKKEDDPFERETQLRVQTEGVSSLEDLRRLRDVWKIPASGEGKFQLSPPFEWIAHSLLEEIMKKDLNKEYKYTGKPGIRK